MSLIAWKDTDRIEMADRIVIGTVTRGGDMSVVTVEKVLKGGTESKTIRTRFQPRDADRSPDLGGSGKVVLVEKDEDFGMNPKSEVE